MPNVGLIPDDAFVDQLKLLLDQELQAAMDRIRAKVLLLEGPGGAGTLSEDFDLELGEDDVQVFYDESPESGDVRVNLVPAGVRSPREFQLFGPGTGQAQRDEDVEIDIVVMSDDATDDTLAFRKCCRVVAGILEVLMRYPDLRVPAPLDLPALAMHVGIGSTDRLRGEEDRPMDKTSLVVPLRIRTRRVVSTT